MVITVNKHNMKYFKGLAPDDFVDFVENPDCFIFGALTEYNDVDGVCAGLLITELIREWLTEDLYEYGLYIRWLYVSPATRQKGLANELIDALYDVLNKSKLQLDGIICEIPIDDKYNLLCHYLVDIGFSMTFDYINDLFLSMDDIISNNTLLNICGFGRHSSSIKNLSSKELKNLLNLIDSSGPGFYRVSENFVENNLDKQLSCVILSGKEIIAATIWIKRPSGLYEMVRIWTKDTSMPRKQVLTMLGYSIRNATNLQDSTEGFLIHCDYNPEIIDLLSDYCEDFNSEMIRRATYDRGITDILDFYGMPE